jgi:RimJ/RimL family protein N-acetyltransferase
MESIQQAQATIERWTQRTTTGAAYEGFWAVERKSDGVVAGTQLLVPLEGGQDGEIEIGWHFHPDSWGQGLASESAMAVLGWGFGHSLPEIRAVVHADNDPSMAVCRRIGMSHLGSTAQYYGIELELFRIEAPRV